MRFCEILDLDQVIRYLLESRSYLGTEEMVRIHGELISRDLLLRDRVRELTRTRSYFLSTKSNDSIYRKRNRDGSYTRYPPARILLEEARVVMEENQKTPFRHIVESEKQKKIPLTRRINSCEELNAILNQKYESKKTKISGVVYGFSSVVGINGFMDSRGNALIFLVSFKDPVPVIRSSLSEKMKTNEIYHYIRSDSPNRIYAFFTHMETYWKLIEIFRQDSVQLNLNQFERPNGLSEEKNEKEVIQLSMDDVLEQVLLDLDDSIDSIASESTASEVSDKMEFIRDEILIMRQRLQEARENNDLKKVKKICDNGIITLKKYYKEIEDVPETLWENVGMGILRNVISIANITVSIVSFVLSAKANPIGLKDKVSMIGSGVSVISTLTSKLKESIDGVNYKKINDKYFGNKNRKGFGNEVKEKSLKMINDNILILQRVKNEI